MRQPDEYRCSSCRLLVTLECFCIQFMLSLQYDVQKRERGVTSP